MNKVVTHSLSQPRFSQSSKRGGAYNVWPIINMDKLPKPHILPKRKLPWRCTQIKREPRGDTCSYLTHTKRCFVVQASDLGWCALMTIFYPNCFMVLWIWQVTVHNDNKMCSLTKQLKVYQIQTACCYETRWAQHLLHTVWDEQHHSYSEASWGPGRLSLNTADVRRALKRINPRKSPGPDGIPGRVLSGCADQLEEVFTSIFKFAYRPNNRPDSLHRPLPPGEG